MPHAVHREILAVVVADPSGPEATGQGLIEWTRERVPHYKRPRLVEFVEELPLGPSRKVL